MTEQLAKTLDLHEKWLRSHPDGVRAYLNEANLSGANLNEANLRGANLRGANLRLANLRGANLRGAYLSGANLNEANLSGANLSGANLSGANLSGAYLSGAYLSGANLRWANLSGAYLRGAAGLLCLPIAEPRCYRHVAVATDGQWVISAGCRNFTVAEAREHWGAADYSGPREVAETYPAALDWLEKQEVPK